MSIDAYSKQVNDLFYNNINGKEEFGLLKSLGNEDKSILILHELYVSTSMFRRGNCNMSLDHLIEKCGYKTNQKSRKSFKKVLNDLKKIKMINFEGDVDNNKMFCIDTTPLFDKTDNDFIKLYDSEINKFTSISDLRARTSIIKLYLYLKTRICDKSYKDIGFNITFQTNKLIRKYTNINEWNLENYINILQNLNLITYKDINKNISIYKNEKIVKMIHPTIYAINSFHDNISDEINNGMEIYKKKLIDDGYSVISTNENYYKIYYDNLENLTLKGIYLIRNQYNNALKIGICSDLNRRFNEIKGSFKFCGLEPDLRIECFIETNNNYIIEQYLHKEFADVNYQNEWFSINDINIVLNKIKEYSQ
jgi:hypothetical protein